MPVAEKSSQECLKKIHAAKKFLEKGKLEPALAELQQAKLYDSYNPEVYLCLAQVYFHQGKFNEAMISCSTALELNPNDPEIFFQMGWCSVYLQKIETAMDFFQKTIQSGGRAAESHWAMGILYDLKGENEEALKHSHLAMTLTKDTKTFGLIPQCLKNENASMDLKSLILALKNTAAPYVKKGFPRDLSKKRTRQTTEDFLDRGIALTRKGKLEQASDTFRKGLTLDPEHVPLLIQMGLSYYHRRNFSQAIDFFQKALQLQPQHTESYYLTGCAYFKQDMLDAAIESFRRAIKINPNYAEARYSLGAAYEKKGLTRESYEEFERAYRLAGVGAKNLVPTVLSYEEQARREQKESPFGRRGIIFQSIQFALCSTLGTLGFVFRQLDKDKNGILGNWASKLEENVRKLEKL